MLSNVQERMGNKKEKMAKSWRKDIKA